MMDAVDLVSCLTEEEAKAVLLFLCRDDETCQTIDSLTTTLREANRTSNTTSAVICVRCEKAFTLKDNGNEACIYHKGLLEPDYDSDFWADYDEKVCGDVDTKSNRKDYPDGFYWSCCGELGSEDGCRTGDHQADPTAA
ncbi:hypothetical protein IF1G_11135 [Cordyceps javanica]|uniref:Uncharacterized protein n=1 Tax=Cordyceps javanica TaxID=43265 RepID=A0A545UL53_9HYPO|nr:hypothetical protein IF1G_11135 [Cordyceps javanica]